MVKYTHLIIGGGGIKGIAFIGALEIIDKYSSLDKIESFIGSSIGGLITFLLSIDYKPKELYDIFLNINLNKYRNIRFSEIFKNYGIDNCEQIMKLLYIIAKQKNIESQITFRELYEKTNKTLILTGSDILNNKTEYYNYYDTPDMNIFEALRITISYPIIYNPIKKENKLIVDGALLNPYPIRYFETVEKKIGLMISSNYSGESINTFEDYIFSIIRSLVYNYEHFHSKDYQNSTITIDISEIYSMNFDLTKEDKIFMYQKGIDAAKLFFKDMK